MIPHRKSTKIDKIVMFYTKIVYKIRFTIKGDEMTRIVLITAILGTALFANMGNFCK